MSEKAREPEEAQAGRRALEGPWRGLGGGGLGNRQKTKDSSKRTRTRWASVLHPHSHAARGAWPARGSHYSPTMLPPRASSTQSLSEADQGTRGGSALTKPLSLPALNRVPQALPGLSHIARNVSLAFLVQDDCANSTALPRGVAVSLCDLQEGLGPLQPAT